MILWAADCVEHVLAIFIDVSSDERPQNAINMARKWAEGRISVGDARNATFAAHDAARNIKNRSIAAADVARAAGHAVATAHMADHCLQAAAYSLKAIKHSSLSVLDELKWQNENLPEDIKELVLDARNENAKN